MHDVDRVVTAQRFGQNVAHAGTFQHRTSRTTGDHTGTGAGRAQQHHAGRGFALYRVDDGPTDHRNAEETLTSFLDALGDRSRDFLGLAVTDTDHPVAVADD